MNEKLEDIESEVIADIKKNIKPKFKDVKRLEGELDIDDFKRLVVCFPVCFVAISDDPYTDISGQNNRKFERETQWDFFIGLKHLGSIAERKSQAQQMLREVRNLLVSDKWEFAPVSATLMLNLEGGSVYLFRFKKTIYWSRDYQG